MAVDEAALHDRPDPRGIFAVLSALERYGWSVPPRADRARQLWDAIHSGAVRETLAGEDSDILDLDAAELGERVLSRATLAGLEVEIGRQLDVIGTELATAAVAELRENADSAIASLRPGFDRALAVVRDALAAGINWTTTGEDIARGGTPESIRLWRELPDATGELDSIARTRLQLSQIADVPPRPGRGHTAGRVNLGAAFDASAPAWSVAPNEPSSARWLRLAQLDGLGLLTVADSQRADES